MRVFLALIVGIIIGAAALWIYSTHQAPKKSPLQSAGDKLESAAKSTRESIERKVSSFNLGTNAIKEELARTGRVIRQKAEAAGHAIADATADARTTTAIKGKLVAARDVPGMSMSVNTSGGVVTLSGTVSSVEQVSKAMKLALETDGVRQVISTLQVKANSVAGK